MFILVFDSRSGVGDVATIRISGQRYAFFWFQEKMMMPRNAGDGQCYIRMPATVKLSLKA